MGNSVLIKLQAEDNLTPTLRQNRDELARLFGSIRELDAALRTMRANRAGIISGDIRSDIAEIARLQDELQRVRAAGNRSDTRRAEAELRRALATETNNLTAAIREQRDEYQRLSIVASRSYEHYRRQQAAAQRATEANNRDTQSLRNNNAVRNSNINSLVRHIRQIETLVVSVYGLKRAYDVLLGSGISLHRQIESQTAGIAALITANTRLASGSKDLIKHFKIASQTAEQTMKKIKSASVETAATFPELTAIFQQAVGGALGAGKAMGDTIEKQIDNTITLSKRMSNIASAIGMPMQQVNEEIRSIIEGTTDINSRIAKMIGITNEEIRKAKTEKDGLVKYLNEKLKPFDALADIQSFDRMVARIRDSIDNIKLGATEEAFKQIKLHLKDLNDWMATNKDEITKNIASGIKNTADAIKTAVVFVKEWKDEILLLAKAFVVFKAGGWVVGGVESLIANFRRASESLGLVTTSATGATRAINILKTALFALRGALAGLAIYGAIELFTRLNQKVQKNKIDFEKLNAVLEKTNEEITKMSAPELSRDEGTLTDARKKIADQIYDTYRRIQEAKQEGGIGSGDMIGFYEKNLDALAAKLKQIDDQLKNVKDSKKEATEAEKKYNQTIKEQKEYLEAIAKLSPDVQKLVEKYGKEVFTDDDAKKLKELADAIKKAKEDLEKVLDNPQLVQELNNTIENLTIKKGGLEKKIADDAKAAAEKAANEAKQAHAEAMRRAKEKADWQIKHAKAVGDTEKALRLELQQYEKELQELISKGYITREQKADFLRQKEKEYHEKKLKEQKEIDESFEKEFDDRRNAQKDFYTAIGDYQKAAVVAAELELKKLVELAQKAGVVIDKDLAEKLKKIAEENAKKGFEKFNKEAKKSFKDLKNSWANTVSTMQKTVDDGFFNFFIGKTKSLKKALKDMGTNLMRDLISPYARTLSQGISGGFGALLGGGSNLASVASSLGLAKNDSGGWIGSVGGTTVELSSTGEILRGASALDKSTTNLLSSISNLKSAYSAFTGLLQGGYKGLVGSALSPLSSLSTYLYNAGYPTLGSGVLGFQYGSGTVLGAYSGSGLATAGTAAKIGAAGGGALTMGGLGYAAGMLGDKLTGTQTKAGMGGLIGGGIGGGLVGAGLASNPVGWVIAAVGLVIGSFISKAKTTDAGLFLKNAIVAATGENVSLSDMRSYTEKTKKNWWKSTRSWEYGELDSKTRELVSQSIKAVQLSLRGISATGGLALSAGHFSANSFLNDNLALAALSSFTGLGRNLSLEDGQRGKIKKWNLSNIFAGVGMKKLWDKAGGFISGALGDKAEKLLRYGALGGAYGMAPQLALKDKTAEFQKSAAQIEAENARLVEMRKSFEAYAKEQKKEVIQVITEALSGVKQAVTEIDLMGLSNPIHKAAKTLETAIDTFDMATDGAFGEIGDILAVKTEEFKEKYLSALRENFTKENLDKWQAAKTAFEAARRAQDEYTKAVLNFTQQIASSQASFYQAHGIDSSFMSYQSLYTRFRAILGSLEHDLDKKDLQSVSNKGNINDWAKYFLGLSSHDLGGFLSSGNTELRQELLKILTEYKNLVTQNGGHEYWLKSMSDLEALNKQIEALKLAQKVQDAQEQLKANMQANLDAQKAQLELLKAQKSAVEKLANIVQKIRDNVIDRTTSSINYQTALEQARKAYASGDYQSKAFDNLSSAADLQSKYFEETSLTYEEYKLNMLKMAGEIEGMAGGKTLEDINRAILEVEDKIKKSTKMMEEQFKNLNKTGQDQLLALEQQRQSLIESSQKQIEQMTNLLGGSSPIVSYLRNILAKLMTPTTDKDGKTKTPEVPEYTTPGNVNIGITTANGALLTGSLEKQINQMYLQYLGRSVEQGGLDFWKARILAGDTTIQKLPQELVKAITAETGSSDMAVWKEYYKSKGVKPFADGGIVTRPTRALIGEAGYPEAVIPLKGGKGVKIDTDGGFKILERGIERLESVVRGMAKDIREIALTDRNTTNGDERYVRLVGIPTVRIEK